MTRMQLMFCIVCAAATCGTCYGQQLAVSDVREGVHSAGIPVVTVTARRREESIQSVPLSIVAKVGEDLSAAEVDSVDELSRLVPGFSVTGNDNLPQAGYFLRGIGTNSGSTAVDASVGVVVDGAVMPYTTVFGEDLSDVARVEVLRGPQGTLFGKNASAGLLNYTTKDPTEGFSASAGLGYGSYNEVKFNGSVSGPVAGESLLGRLSYYANRRDGYIKDATGGPKVGDDDTESLRGVLLYRPTATTRIRMSAYNVWRGRGIQRPAVAFQPIVSLGPLSTPLQIQRNSDLAGPENTSVRVLDVNRVYVPTHYWGSTLQLDQELGDYTLTSITSYLDYKWIQDFQATQAAFPSPPQSINYQVQADRLLTEELRLSSPLGGWVDYQGGLYFYRETHSFDLDISDTSTRIFGDYSAPTKTINYAAFGEANFHLSDSVTLIGGTRWTHEKKDIVLTSVAAPAGYIGIFPVANSPDSVTVRNWSWRAGGQWKPTEKDMLYATVSRGFKGPGFNSVNFTVGTSQQVAPEIATTYEVGAKTIWWEGRLSGDIALYHTTFRDLQNSAIAFATKPDGSFLLDASGNRIVQRILVNAGDLRSRGVEFELLANPFAGFNLSLAGAYIDGVYKDYTNAPCYLGQAQFETGCSSAVNGVQDLSGTRLRAPKYSGNVGGGHEWNFGSLPFNGFLRADYQWRSETPLNANDPFSGLPSVGLLNMSVGIRGKDNHYAINFYVKNLTNKFYEIQRGGGETPRDTERSRITCRWTISGYLG